LDVTKAVEELSSVLETVYERHEANAAVTLLLQIANQNLRILFVKRIENPADSWSGQMALPGGKRDDKDRDLKETVVREVLEEVNIDILDRCRFLGNLPSQRSKRRPEMSILPFVILLEQEPSIKVNKREVERFIWFSLKELVQNEGIVRLSLGERPAYIIGECTIWGLTYRILRSFIEALTF
jgi:8-oxo-dGTP pyrophosphatase MutT (NUDIX family)